MVRGSRQTLILRDKCRIENPGCAKNKVIKRRSENLKSLVLCASEI